MAALGLLLLVAAHTADYVTFVALVLVRGVSAEANPIVAALAVDFGLELLTVAKVAAVLLMAATVIVVGRQHPRVASVMLAVGILAGTFATYTNLASI